MLASAKRSAVSASRVYQSQSRGFAKVVCALYPGGEAGRRNPNILGCVENGLNLREWAKDNGHELVITSDKDGDQSTFMQELKTADIAISQPFWPAYLTPERIAASPHLKLAITAGVGSDHVDLGAAAKAGITVAEVTGSNVVSVAEHVVMQILALVRNYIPGYKQVINGEWDIAKQADRAFDLEHKHVGTVAAGRIGYRVLQRLKPFDCHLHYFDTIRLPSEAEEWLGVKYHDSIEAMVPQLDVITINCPLHPGTEHLFDRRMLEKCKPGVWIVNTARGKIVDAEALADAVDSGHVAGYAGDVWFPQPAPRTHPWRLMPNHAMTPHVSGTTLDAQARYAAGVREILDCYTNGKPIRNEFLILDKGKLASPSYTAGGTTKGAL
jgi:formate dehydrogenase